MGTTAATITETVKVSASDALVKQGVITLHDTVVVAPSFKRTWKLPATVRDVARFTFKGSLAQVLHATITSSFKLTTSTRLGFKATLRSGVKISSAMLVRQGVTLRETVAIAARSAAPGIYHRAIAARVLLRDHLPGMRLGGLLRDAVRVGATLLSLRRTVAAAVEKVEIEDVLTHKLQLIVFQTDGIELTEDTILRAIYNGVLSDTVDFIIDVVDPGGNTTTWAMNVRTGAVTEYLNHAFNSFTRSANGTHLAAGPDGLYELVGQDDDGEPIPAVLTGGMVDFSGPYLSSLQAVYIGLRGDGQFFLRLTQGDGRSATYAVRAQSLKTARVNVGKGWRARYFTWELATSGQDFDLLDIDFLPVQQLRRI